VELQTAWSPPPLTLPTASEDIHVWRAFLNRACPSDSNVALSRDELARAARFVFPRDRNRYVAARDILRAILARHIGVSAQAIELEYEPDGKPRLGPISGDPPIRFNLSHSEDLAVYAVSSAREVGVDVEAIRPAVLDAGIPEQFFSRAEVEKLRALPAGDQVEAFFLCWTRKEAYIKARGAGLGIPLDSFTVSLTPGEPATLTSVDSSRWMLRSFQPAPGYAGALVAEGRSERIHFWNWNGVP